MDSPIVAVALTSVLALLMFGLGTSLTPSDFARVRGHARAVVTALACQCLVLPVVCFGLVAALGLDPTLSVGMMLLAASPGGSTANLLSHLFRGDVALNITLTAVNSMLAVITLPLLTNLALDHFSPTGGDGVVGLQFGKLLQVCGMVLVPVVIGMAVRRQAPAFADRCDGTIRKASTVLILLITVGAIAAERANITSYLADVGVVVTLFCACSLGLGYVVPRVLGIERPQAIACSMEIGIHNSTLAMTVAISVLGSVEMAVPPATYGALAYPFALAFGWFITRGDGDADANRDPEVARAGV